MEKQHKPTTPIIFRAGKSCGNTHHGKAGKASLVCVFCCRHHRWRCSRSRATSLPSRNPGLAMGPQGPQLCHPYFRLGFPIWNHPLLKHGPGVPPFLPIVWETSKKWASRRFVFRLVSLLVANVCFVCESVGKAESGRKPRSLVTPQVRNICSFLMLPKTLHHSSRALKATHGYKKTAVLSGRESTGQSSELQPSLCCSKSSGHATPWPDRNSYGNKRISEI